MATGIQNIDASGWYRHSASPIIDGRYPLGRPISAVVSGGVLRITHSSSLLGTKSNPAPILFNDFETYSVGVNALAAGLDNLGNDGKGYPVVTNTKSFSGTKSLMMEYIDTYNSMFPRVGKSLTSPVEEIYHSYRLFYEKVSGTPASSPIFKLDRGGANPPYSGVPRFYQTIRPNSVTGIEGGSDRGYVRETGPGLEVDIASGPNSGAWAFIETSYKLSTPNVADGFFRIKVDGVFVVNSNNIVTRQNEASKIDYVMSCMDGMDSYGPDGYYRVWMDEWYVDSTPQKVLVGDAATFSSCNILQPIAVSDWTPSLITANYDAARFGAGNKYVYIKDSSDNLLYENGMIVE